MNMKNKIYYLFILLAFFCCTDEAKIPANNIKVSLIENNMVEASNVFADFQMIPLESSKKSLIAKIAKLVVDENRYFILDTKQHKLFVFSINGEFLNVIDNKGKGPNEYISLDDFVIYKSKLFLLSRLSKKIFQYDSSSLDLEKTIKVKHQYTKINKGQKDTLILYCDFNAFGDDELFNVHYFSLKKKSITAKFSPFLKKQNGELSYGVNRKVFSRNNNNLYVSLPAQHRIMVVGSKETETFVNIDFGLEYKLPKNSFNYSYEEIKKLENNLSWNLDNVHIDDEIIHFTYNFNYLEHLVVYNRIKKTIVVNGYVTSDFKIPFGLNNKIIVENNNIISYLNPEVLINEFYKKKTVKDIIRKKGYNVEDLLKNNNPILLKFKL